jgi:hypothetical protein
MMNKIIGSKRTSCNSTLLLVSKKIREPKKRKHNRNKIFFYDGESKAQSDWVRKKVRFGTTATMNICGE